MNCLCVLALTLACLAAGETLGDIPESFLAEPEHRQYPRIDPSASSEVTETEFLQLFQSSKEEPSEMASQLASTIANAIKSAEGQDGRRSFQAHEDSPAVSESDGVEEDLVQEMDSDADSTSQEAHDAGAVESAKKLKASVVKFQGKIAMKLAVAAHEFKTKVDLFRSTLHGWQQREQQMEDQWPGSDDDSKFRQLGRQMESDYLDSAKRYEDSKAEGRSALEQMWQLSGDRATMKYHKQAVHTAKRHADELVQSWMKQARFAFRVLKGGYGASIHEAEEYARTVMKEGSAQAHAMEQQALLTATNLRDAARAPLPAMHQEPAAKVKAPSQYERKYKQMKKMYAKEVKQHATVVQHSVPAATNFVEELDVLPAQAPKSLLSKGQELVKEGQEALASAEANNSPASVQAQARKIIADGEATMASGRVAQKAAANVPPASPVLPAATHSAEAVSDEANDVMKRGQWLVKEGKRALANAVKHGNKAAQAAALEIIQSGKTTLESGRASASKVKQVMTAVPHAAKPAVVAQSLSQSPAVPKVKQDPATQAAVQQATTMIAEGRQALAEAQKNGNGAAEAAARRIISDGEQTLESTVGKPKSLAATSTQLKTAPKQHVRQHLAQKADKVVRRGEHIIQEGNAEMATAMQVHNAAAVHAAQQVISDGQRVLASGRQVEGALKAKASPATTQAVAVASHRMQAVVSDKAVDAAMQRARHLVQQGKEGLAKAQKDGDEAADLAARDAIKDGEDTESSLREAPAEPVPEKVEQLLGTGANSKERTEAEKGENLVREGRQALQDAEKHGNKQAEVVAHQIITDGKKTVAEAEDEEKSDLRPISAFLEHNSNYDVSATAIEASVGVHAVKSINADDLADEKIPDEDLLDEEQDTAQDSIHTHRPHASAQAVERLQPRAEHNLKKGDFLVTQGKIELQKAVHRGDDAGIAEAKELIRDGEAIRRAGRTAKKLDAVPAAPRKGQKVAMQAVSMTAKARTRSKAGFRVSEYHNAEEKLARRAKHFKSKHLKRVKSEITSEFDKALEVETGAFKKSTKKSLKKAVAKLKKAAKKQKKKVKKAEKKAAKKAVKKATKKAVKSAVKAALKKATKKAKKVAKKEAKKVAKKVAKKNVAKKAFKKAAKKAKDVQKKARKVAKKQLHKARKAVHDAKKAVHQHQSAVKSAIKALQKEAKSTKKSIVKKQLQHYKKAAANKKGEVKKALKAVTKAIKKKEKSDADKYKDIKKKYAGTMLADVVLGKLRKWGNMYRFLVKDAEKKLKKQKDDFKKRKKHKNAAAKAKAHRAIQKLHKTVQHAHKKWSKRYKKAVHMVHKLLKKKADKEKKGLKKIAKLKAKYMAAARQAKSFYETKYKHAIAKVAAKVNKTIKSYRKEYAKAVVKFKTKLKKVKAERKEGLKMMNLTRAAFVNISATWPALKAKLKKFYKDKWAMMKRSYRVGGKGVAANVNISTHPSRKLWKAYKAKKAAEYAEGVAHVQAMMNVTLAKLPRKNATKFLELAKKAQQKGEKILAAAKTAMTAALSAKKAESAAEAQKVAIQARLAIRHAKNAILAAERAGVKNDQYKAEWLRERAVKVAQKMAPKAAQSYKAIAADWAHEKVQVANKVAGYEMKGQKRAHTYRKAWMKKDEKYHKSWLAIRKKYSNEWADFKNWKHHSAGTKTQEKIMGGLEHALKKGKFNFAAAKTALKKAKRQESATVKADIKRSRAAIKKWLRAKRAKARKQRKAHKRAIKAVMKSTIKNVKADLATEKKQLGVEKGLKNVKGEQRVLKKIQKTVKDAPKAISNIKKIAAADFKKKESQVIKKSLLQVMQYKAKKKALKKHMAHAQAEALLEEKALAEKYPGVADVQPTNEKQYQQAQQKARAAGHADRAAESAFQAALKAAGLQESDLNM
jgi:hypothetical protein